MTWYAITPPSTDTRAMIVALRDHQPAYDFTLNLLLDVVTAMEAVIAFRKPEISVHWAIDLVHQIFSEDFLSRKGGAI